MCHAAAKMCQYFGAILSQKRNQLTVSLKKRDKSKDAPNLSNSVVKIQRHRSIFCVEKFHFCKSHPLQIFRNLHQIGSVGIYPQGSFTLKIRDKSHNKFAAKSKAKVLINCSIKSAINFAANLWILPQILNVNVPLKGKHTGQIRCGFSAADLCVETLQRITVSAKWMRF